MCGKYILEGHTPVLCEDVLEWGVWIESADRHIATTEIGTPVWLCWLCKLLKIKRWEPVRISTVFLGLDHRFGDSGEPLLFETMIFGGLFDEEMWRYTTWERAEKGHKNAVKIARHEISI